MAFIEIMTSLYTYSYLAIRVVEYCDILIYTLEAKWIGEYKKK